MRRIPGPLWISIAAMVVMTALTVFAMLKSGSPALFLAAVCNVALLAGLTTGQKWAYVVTVVFCILGALVALSRGVLYGLVILLGNGLVLLPVLLSTGFFFRPGEQRGDE